MAVVQRGGDAIVLLTCFLQDNPKAVPRVKEIPWMVEIAYDLCSSFNGHHGQEWSSPAPLCVSPPSLCKELLPLHSSKAHKPTANFAASRKGLNAELPSKKQQVKVRQTNTGREMRPSPKDCLRDSRGHRLY